MRYVLLPGADGAAFVRYRVALPQPEPIVGLLVAARPGSAQRAG